MKYIKTYENQTLNKRLKQGLWSFVDYSFGGIELYGVFKLYVLYKLQEIWCDTELIEFAGKGEGWHFSIHGRLIQKDWKQSIVESDIVDYNKNMVIPIPKETIKFYSTDKQEVQNFMDLYKDTEKYNL